MLRMPDMYDWLQEGVPLTLLLDLLDPTGPNSKRILEAEPAEVAWISAA